jgi:hypothetical protein
MNSIIYSNSNRLGKQTNETNNNTNTESNSNTNQNDTNNHNVIFGPLKGVHIIKQRIDTDENVDAELLLYQYVHIILFILIREVFDNKLFLQVLLNSDFVFILKDGLTK